MKNTIVAVCIALSGCAGFPHLQQLGSSQHESYVTQEIDVFESEQIAQDMVQFLAKQLPPAQTTIELEPSTYLFQDILIRELAAAGFGVIEHDQEQSVQVRYFVTTLDGGLLVRLKYRDNMASRYYNRLGEGELSFASAYSVREATQ